MEGVNDEGRAQREINEGGEAGRGRAWSKRRGEGGWRVLGGRKIRARQAGGGRTGRTGGRKTPMLSARHGYAQKHAGGC